MSRFAVFVDAGYFYAAGAVAVSGSPASRHNVSINSTGELARAIADRASGQCANSALLRIYWYDAIQGPRMSLEQATLAKEPGVKVRLGSLNAQGEQKGVDSLVVTDLIELARNKAIADAVVVSGDEDLRIAVQVAQSFGVRVHILAVGDAARNVSPSLQMEADSVESLEPAWLARHLTVRGESTARAATGPQQAQSKQAAAPAAAMSLPEAANAVAQELLRPLQPGDISALFAHFAGDQSVPPEFDRKLIAKTATRIGRQLEAAEKRQIRGVFVTQVRMCADFEVQRRKVLAVGVKNLYPAALHELREFLVSRGLAAKPGFREFYDAWLSSPIVEVGQSVSGPWISAQQIDEMREQLTALRL